MIIIVQTIILLHDIIHIFFFCKILSYERTCFFSIQIFIISSFYCREPCVWLERARRIYKELNKWWAANAGWMKLTVLIRAALLALCMVWLLFRLFAVCVRFCLVALHGQLHVGLKGLMERELHLSSAHRAFTTVGWQGGNGILFVCVVLNGFKWFSEVNWLYARDILAMDQ